MQGVARVGRGHQNTPCSTQEGIRKGPLKTCVKAGCVDSLLGSSPDPVGDLLVLEGHSEDVLVVEPLVLHGLDETPGLVTGHGCVLLEDALQGPADIGSHGDVPTHIEMAPLLHQLFDHLVSILLQQVLHIHLGREERRMWGEREGWWVRVKRDNKGGWREVMKVEFEEGRILREGGMRYEGSG